MPSVVLRGSQLTLRRSKQDPKRESCRLETRAPMHDAVFYGGLTYS